MKYFEIIWNQEPGGNIQHIDEHELTPEERQRGGVNAAHKPAPDGCEHCAERGYTRHCQHAGHLGWAGLVKVKGSPEAAGKWLSHMGLMAIDPAPWNGAWQNRGKP